jgi:hypothetical protein
MVALEMVILNFEKQVERQGALIRKGDKEGFGKRTCWHWVPSLDSHQGISRKQETVNDRMSHIVGAETPESLVHASE